MFFPSKQEETISKYPIIKALVAHMQTEAGKDMLKYTAILFAQHLIDDLTVTLVDCFLELGAKNDNLYGMGKVYSTVPGIDTEVKKRIGYNNLLANIIENYRDITKTFTEIYDKEADPFLTRIMGEIAIKGEKGKIKRLIILDDGDVVTTKIMKSKKPGKLPNGAKLRFHPEYVDEFVRNCAKIFPKIPVVVAEQTTRGVVQYNNLIDCVRKDSPFRKLSEQGKGVTFEEELENEGTLLDESDLQNVAYNRPIWTPPIICIASSAPKVIIEKHFIIDAILRKLLALYPKLADENTIFGVVGVGTIGKAVIDGLIRKRGGGKVNIRAYDKNEEKYKSDPKFFEGIISQTLIGLIEESEYIIFCTGEDLSKYYLDDLDQLRKRLKNNKTLISCSTERIEFQSLLRKFGTDESNWVASGDEKKKGIFRTLRLKPINHENPGCSFNIACGGWPANFAQIEVDGVMQYTSVPTEDFQVIEALLLSGVLQAQYTNANIKNVRKIFYYVEQLNPHIQEFIMHNFYQMYYSENELNAQQNSTKRELLRKRYPHFHDEFHWFINAQNIDQVSTVYFTEDIPKTGHTVSNPVGFGIKNPFFCYTYKDNIEKFFTEKVDWSNLSIIHAKTTKEREHLQMERSALVWQREKIRANELVMEYGVDTPEKHYVRTENYAQLISLMPLPDEKAETVNIINKIALTGIGGIGKSSLVTVYANDYKRALNTLLEHSRSKMESTPIICWLNAETKEILTSEYQLLAERLGSPKENIERKKDEDENVFIKRLVCEVSNALRGRQFSLLIFDNVDHAEGYSISQFLPMGEQKNLNIIVTSQKEVFFGEKQDLLVKKFDRLSGLALLKNITGMDEEDDGSATAIVEELDGLPLAIRIAASYIVTTNIAYRDYLLYLKEKTEMLKDGEKNLIQHARYPKTQKETLLIAINKIRGCKDNYIDDFLFICGFLPSDEILKTTVTLYLRIKYPENNHERLQDQLEALINKIELLLSRYSLLTIKKQQGACYYTMHRTVQKVIRDLLIEGAKKNAVEEFEHLNMISSLVTALEFTAPNPKKISNRTEKKQWVNQAQHCLELFEAMHIASNQIKLSPLYLILAGVENDLANFENASVYYEKLQKIELHREEPNHLDLASMCHDEGKALLFSRKPYDALQKFREALSIRRKYLKNDNDPLIAQTLAGMAIAMYNLGDEHNSKGESELAQIHYNNSLNESLRAQSIQQYCWPNTFNQHKAYAKTLTAIGLAYQAIKNHGKSMESFIDAKNILEKLGGKKLTLAMVYSNIGVMHQSQRNYEEALNYHKLALQIDEKQLVKEHPSIHDGMLNIALTLHGIYNSSHQDKHKEETLFYYNKAREILLKKFGPTDERIQRINTALNSFKQDEEEQKIERETERQSLKELEDDEERMIQMAIEKSLHEH